MTIYKYPLEIADNQIVSMPAGSTILCVQVQHGKLCLWAKVHEESLPEERHIEIRGTGHELKPGLTYIGTAQMAGGSLVWHVFERIR